MAGEPQIRSATVVERDHHLVVARDQQIATEAGIDVEDLRRALRELGGEGPGEVHVRPGALEVTHSLADGAVWETVLVPAQVFSVDGELRWATTVDLRSLRESVADRDATSIRIGSNGAMTVGEVVLTPLRCVFRPPPRPTATGVLRQRLELPRSAAGIEMILRLEGPNVCVPEAVRRRFGQRLVSSVSLFEDDGEWFISGVRNGTPTLVVVGSVAVY